MTDRLADWVALVDACYPQADAEGWDAVGLHVGAPEDAVGAVLVSLDVTPGVVAEAAEAGRDLLVAHHPLLFRPLARLTHETAAGRTALAAARAGVAVIAAHTNLDVALPGTSDPVVGAARRCGTWPRCGRRRRRRPSKLVTFVPIDATEQVLDALAGAGAGVIGAYDQCSFRVAGTGSFRPSAEADPVIGQRGAAQPRRGGPPRDDRALAARARRGHGAAGGAPLRGGGLRPRAAAGGPRSAAAPRRVSAGSATCRSRRRCATSPP